MPWKTYSFGKLQQTLSYDATSTVDSGQLGTIKSATDGNGNITTLSGWKRGIPQSIKYPITPESPTGATQSAVVNDNGWITSVTDENDYTTNYTYDDMGRLASIVHPTGDTVAWLTTTQVFEPVAVVEYGIAAGHWRQTITTGNAKKITYFDALWRPLVTKELDATDGTTETLTKRFQRFTYDHEGRVTFASYPGTTDALTTGTWTEYDALGRATSVSQDSELGLLTNTTEYLTGFKTRTTNPKGHQTTSSYMAYDQPTMGWPMDITHPAGVVTKITRDAFGKPLSARRQDVGNTLSVTRSYTYNGFEELCRSAEPETGATLMGYDSAGNLAWSAAGLPAATACDPTGTTTTIVARKASRTYDARNRVKTLSFPDGLGNTSTTYTPDGLPSSLVASNGGTVQATTNYLYNKRRLLTRETLITPDLNWPYDYVYNANGHLAVNNWHGLSIDYAPNALGQPTKAGTYASNVTYYPNGAIKQFTYGNGLTHVMWQTANRPMPDRSFDCVFTAGACEANSKKLDLNYDFDQNGNVSAITDLKDGRQTRGMTYDALDRITQTTSAMFGTASYGYNVLDNLTTVNVTAGSKARNHTYVYDAATNRLANVKLTATGETVIGLEYDEQGNLEDKSGVDFVFDYSNRLRTVTDPVAVKTSTYAYDALGRRVKDTVNGVAKLSQYNRAGQLVMTGDSRANKVNEYIYLGGSLLAIRERDVPTAVYTTKYQHTDALGTPIAMSSQSQTLLETSEYEPFGQQVNVVGAAKDGPGYTGHVQDAATGLTYMQQRYYDPGIGRFLSVDPVAANSVSFNRYNYGNNNPYRFTDPDGRNFRDWLRELLGGGGDDPDAARSQMADLAHDELMNEVNGVKEEAQDMAAVVVTASPEVTVDTSAKAHLLFFGVSYENGNELNWTSNGIQACSTGSQCMLIGPGMYAGGSVTPTIAVGNMTSQDYYFGVVVEAGAIENVSGEINFNSAGGGISGGGGGGGGGMAAFKVCQVVVRSSGCN